MVGATDRGVDPGIDFMVADESGEQLLDGSLGTGSDGDFSVEIIFTNFIRAQLDSPITPAGAERDRKDFLTEIEARLGFLRAAEDAAGGDPDALDRAYRSVLEALASEIQARLGYDSAVTTGTAPESLATPELAALVRAQYEFAVLGRYRYCVAFLTDYVRNHVAEMAKLVSDPRDRRTQSYAQLLALTGSEDSASVLLHLKRLILDVCRVGVRASELLDGADSEDPGSLTVSAMRGVLDPEDVSVSIGFLAPAISTPEMLHNTYTLVNMNLLPILGKKSEGERR